MTTAKKLPFVLGLVLMCLSFDLLAQQGSSELRGRILDPQEGSLPGVAVILRNQESGKLRQAFSNRDGSYFFPGVVPGTYEISAELSGFKRYQRRDIRLEIGKTATLDIRLELGSVEERLTVRGEAPIVDITSKEVGGNIDSRELTALPSVNRNFIGFIGLLPGIIPNISTESFGSDSVSVNGQDPRNNNYLVDGANNNDDVIGQRAGTQARTPIEAIAEFQVLTSQFDAEFGRTSGAIINAITKQGGNDFHGSAFGYIQDKAITQKDFFAKQTGKEKPDTRFPQYGATLGGPIIQNKVHFFASLERVANDRGTTINIPARPEFNATTTTQDRVWNTLIGLDHQISPKHSWDARWLRETSPQFNQIIPVGTRQVTLAASREEDDTDQTAAFHFNSALGNTQFNTFRLAYTRENVAFASPGFNGNGRRQDLLPPTLEFLTFVDQQSAVAQARINNAYQIEDTFSWFFPGKTGDHDVRTGIQYQYSTDVATAQDNMNGTFSFPTNGPFNAADPRTYPERLSIRVPGPSNLALRAYYLGAFLQDKWRMSDRLTVNLGLRYDVERIPINELDNPRFANKKDYPVDTNNIAPRIGFAYDPTAKGKTVVRGGYGRFYDKTHFELITAIITSGVFSDSFVRNFPANAADPGPSRGQLPTDPFLRNGPVLDRNLLHQMFPPGSRIRNTGTVFLDNPDRRVPYTDQISVGFERAVRENLSLSFDYVHAFGRDQFMSLDLNPGVRVDTTRTGRIDRIDSNFVGQVLTRVNTGKTEYDALEFQIEKRWASDYSFRVSYTWSNSRGNTSGSGVPTSPFQYLGDLRLGQNEGPTDFDRRHNFVFSGSTVVPYTKGLIFSTVVRYLSGVAFTIQDTSVDPDRNGVLFDPLPGGNYSGTGSNGISVQSDGGRNGARGPDFFQADIRLGYRFGLAALGLNKTYLEIFGEVFNLTNRANFDNPTGDRRSTNFLVLTDLRSGGIPRTGQLGARFVF